MKPRQLAIRVLVLLISATPGQLSGAERTRPADIRLSSTTLGELVIPVSVGGKGPYRFLLDTGSSHTAVTESLARALGAARVAQSAFATSVGSIVTAVVDLPDVAVGSVHVESLLATALPPDAAGWLGDGLSGVLGQDFLSQFDYTLDYRTSRLWWHDAGPMDKGIRLALESSNGRFLVSLPQDEGCRCRVRLVADSGASRVVLFTGTAADNLPIDSAGGSMRVSTLAGEGTARPVTVRKLLVGSATLRDVPAARVARHRGTNDDADGLLPLSLFGRVSFHYQQGFIVVEPR